LVRLFSVELVSGEFVKRRAPVRVVPAFRKPVLNVLQPELLPPTLDEMVAPNDPCRLVVKLIELLDLSCLKEGMSLQGAPSYPLEIMLALEMFSKWDGEFGSRRVEKRCKHDVRYKLVCQGHTPDHTTIWRFRQFLGEKLDELLANSVRLGKKAGLEGLGRASIDGTKLPGAASQWRKFRRESEEADNELTYEFEGSSDESSSPSLEATDSAQEATIAKDSGSPELSPQEQAEQIVSLSKKPKTKREKVPCKDPDARTIRARQGHYIVGYNPQVIVDRDTDLIMSVFVSNQASDAALLEPALEKYLQIHGELPSDLLADAGFDTPNNAQVLAELGIEACVSCKERFPFWRLDHEDRPMCPMGHPAVYESSFKKKGIPVIRLIVNECPNCPIRSECLPKVTSTNKAITFDAKADPANWIRQKHKAKSEEGRAMLKERGRTIEFIFARMKERIGLRRLSMWGLEGARIEVGIMALAMNLAVIGAKAGLAGLDALLRALLRLVHMSLRNQRHRQALLAAFQHRLGNNPAFFQLPQYAGIYEA
jgi:transposase